MIYRLLTLEDMDKLQGLMDFYYVEESVKMKTVYPLESISSLLLSNMELFKLSTNNDFLISGAFDGEELVGFAIGRKLNHLWNIAHTVIPSWILVLIYIKEKEWTSPKERLHELMHPIAKVMEDEKFYSWYKVSKFSNTVTQKQMDIYLDKVYSKIINAERYSVTVEAVVNNQNEVDLLSPTYRRMFPLKVHNDVRLILLHHHFRNSLRNFGNAL